jgi:uncharacterized protein YecE (DUF72 family)
LGKAEAGRILVGTAGWSIPRACSPQFIEEGTHLQRYASRMDCTEINSSFSRFHAAATYAKWAASTPPHFRFSVKIPRLITHDRALTRVKAPLERFLEETSALGRKRGPLLVQLPPSFAFNPQRVRRFFDTFRARYEGPVVCEPRHETWFSPEACELLLSFRVARVAADPAVTHAAKHPGAHRGIAYFRLHGSPRTYWSRYSRTYIAALSRKLIKASLPAETWCIFDNTASGAALENALELAHALQLH